MSTRLVHRPARRTSSPQPPQQRVIEAPPTSAGGKPDSGMAQMLMPAVGVLSSVGMMAASKNSMFVVIGAAVMLLTVLGTLGSALSSRGRAGRQRRDNRNRYLDYLEVMREDFASSERAARKEAATLNPPVDALVECVLDPSRLWERRRTDNDFLLVRSGTGRVPVVPATIAQSGSAMNPADPFMMTEAQALANRFALIPDMPLTVPLDRAGNVSIVGDRDGVVRVAKALLLQASVFHAPDDLELAAAFPHQAQHDWAWLSWLPHVLDPERREGSRPFRRLAPTPAELGVLLSEGMNARSKWAGESRRGLGGNDDARRLTRRLLVLHDSYGSVSTEVQAYEGGSAADLGLTVLHLVADRRQEPSSVSVRISVRGDELMVEDLRGAYPVTAYGRVDEVPASIAEGVARLLSPLRLSAESIEEDAHVREIDFLEMLQVQDAGKLDFQQLWRPRSERNFLRVPIGVDPAGAPVVLDLKESAQLGMGPHGLCIGATGSGKSELLRTLVLALLAAHSPEDLAMVLIDYKGGATFAPFEGVPHVAGIITNLVDDPSLTERAYASLAGEVQRRQQMLKDAGNIANITDYRLHRRERRDMPPMPHLFIIIDEFGELLTARPDFIDLFLSIGRIGRSIGVHLLLSSQRIEGGKLRGLETYLSYRLGLRTFSEEESRTVLDTEDAFHLPPLPGYGYLKVDTSIYQRFKAAYVSGAFEEQAAVEVEEEGPVARPYLLTPYQEQAGGQQVQQQEPDDGATERTTGPTLLNVFVDQTKPAAKAVDQVWLPPLPVSCSLDEVAGPVSIDRRGLQFQLRPPALAPPVGVVDDPQRQRQEVFRLDLTKAGGHCAIIGGPQSGKTTLLRTLVMSFAYSHTPAELAIYAIDLGGGGLRPLGDLPHVGGVAIRTDREQIRRTIEEVRGMIDAREWVFRDRGIDTIEQLRQMHAAGSVPELAAAEVAVVIDNFGAIRTSFDDLEDPLLDLIQRGSSYGIHVVATMLRWNDVRMASQSLFGTVLELRLNDPSDSAIDRRLQETLRNAPPGRLLIQRSRLFAQIALPRIDGSHSTMDLTDMMASQAMASRSAWPGPVAPQIRVLPDRLSKSSLPKTADEPVKVPIGLAEQDMEPVLIDLLDRDGSVVVFGDSQCGKTNLLRLMAEQLMERYTSDQLVFAVVDPRRGLRDVLPEAYVGGYATSSRMAAGLAASVSGELASRIPEDTSAVPDPSAWPRVVVLVDDYDLVTTGGQVPFEPFVPYVASARDIAVHFIVARRAAGASRSLYEPFMQSIVESGATGVVMSGDPAEGQLFTGVQQRAMIAGRALLARRGQRPQLIQTALAEGTDGGTA
ncbi:type VII secretion protein EccCa [Kribbella sp. NPDC023855]|uniref:type VII secretion protein EccCa n=1 Tax=Kribbella sp. NPDC023855 TaxID=3154698 RepID=UPI0033D47BFE